MFRTNKRWKLEFSSESAQFDPPSVAIAALSLLPVKPNSKVLVKYPYLSDERL